VQLVEDQEEEDVTLSSTSKHRSGKFQPLLQKVLHDDVREHKNIRMGGTIANMLGKNNTLPDWPHVHESP
jgi:hypothetical protein